MIVPCLLSQVSKPDASYEYPLAWNFSLPLTGIPAPLGDENKLLVSVGSSYRRKYVIPVSKQTGMLDQKCTPWQQGQNIYL